MGPAWAWQQEWWWVGREEGKAQASMGSQKRFQVGPSSGPRSFEGSGRANMGLEHWVPRACGPAGPAPSSAARAKQDLVIPF